MRLLRHHLLNPNILNIMGISPSSKRDLVQSYTTDHIWFQSINDFQCYFTFLPFSKNILLFYPKFYNSPLTKSIYLNLIFYLKFHGKKLTESHEGHSEVDSASSFIGDGQVANCQVRSLKQEYRIRRSSQKIL